MKINPFNLITIILSLIFSPLGITLAQAQTQDQDHPSLRTVPYVDINRYAGLWYQIAFFPTVFQGRCTLNTTAQYTLQTDGTVAVKNECYKSNGTYRSITGWARIVDTETQAKLKVKFFWFAPAGDYWVIDLGQNYEYAVVGEPKRKFLWILSRTPTISKKLYEQLSESAKSNGYDISKLKLTSELSD